MQFVNTCWTLMICTLYFTRIKCEDIDGTLLPDELFTDILLTASNPVESSVLISTTDFNTSLFGSYLLHLPSTTSSIYSPSSPLFNTKTMSSQLVNVTSNVKGSKTKNHSITATTLSSVGGNQVVSTTLKATIDPTSQILINKLPSSSSVSNSNSNTLKFSIVAYIITFIMTLM